MPPSSKMALTSKLVRHVEDNGFVRYVVSCQYHGSSYLGFSYQGPQNENCILPDGTDLKGYRSVEGSIRSALTKFLGGDETHFENIQVSSRTDRGSFFWWSNVSNIDNLDANFKFDADSCGSCFLRILLLFLLPLGVHALKNTFHVDILKDFIVRSRHSSDSDNNHQAHKNDFASRLKKGINYYLARQSLYDETSGTDDKSSSSSLAFTRNSTLRILNAALAPEFMTNQFYQDYPEQPPVIDWNARFSATQRTYIYRILFLPGDQEWGIPFECDRAWSVRLNCHHNQKQQQVDVAAMQQAASILQGTHDVSSFRAAHCQRSSPIVTMNEVSVSAQPYGDFSTLYAGFGDNMLDGNRPSSSLLPSQASAMLVTIKVVGESFVYRQVRNMVGCLVEVGRGKLRPSQVQDILDAKDRSIAPCTAPAHGLFLVDVQHGDFHI